jgi:hypothetical protein
LLNLPAPGPLRLNPKLNTPYLYDGDMSLSSSADGDLSSDFHIQQSWTFDKKTDKGFHAINKIIDATATGMIGDQMPDLKGTVTEVVIDPLGKILSAKSDSGKMKDLSSALGGSAGGYMGVLLPQDPPTVGLTWSYTLDLADVAAQLKDILGSSDTKITFNCRVSDIQGNLVWIESTADKTFTIQQTVEMTGTLHIESESEVDSTDGTIAKTKLKSEMKMNVAGTDVDVKAVLTAARKSS